MLDTFRILLVCPGYLNFWDTPLSVFFIEF
jgi:hypothetical protein